MIDLELVKENKPIELKLEQNSKGGTNNYNELDNKPTINGVELQGNLTLEDLGIIVNAVKDILINGASIIDKNGNAIIPIATTQDTLGLAMYNQYYGVVITNRGYVQVKKANNAQIDKRNGSNHPIVADSTLDYAVKCAMTDGKGAEWTSEEKANARMRLGEEWRYIGKVETQKDVMGMSMALDSNGKPFSLRKVRIVAVNYPNANDLTGYIYPYFNGINFNGICYKKEFLKGLISTDTKVIMDTEFEKIGDHLRLNTYWRSINYTNVTNELGRPSGYQSLFNFDKTLLEGYITEIGLQSYHNAIGKGAYMEIWGVDA